METQTGAAGDSENSKSAVSNPPPAPRPYRLQSRAYAERIARAQAVIRRASGESELAQRLAAQGFTAARLAEGDALRIAAQDAYTARQQAIGAQRAAVEQAENTIRAARRTFNDFRIAMRAYFPSVSAHALLDLDAAVPFDTPGFTHMAQNTCNTALRTPALLTALTPFGYSAERLQAALAELNEVGTTLQAAAQARAAALFATQERQRAVAALDRWVAQLRASARLATRGRPDLKVQLRM